MLSKEGATHTLQFLPQSVWSILLQKQLPKEPEIVKQINSPQVLS